MSETLDEAARLRDREKAARDERARQTAVFSKDYLVAYDAHVEQVVIGTMLQEPAAVLKCLSMFKPEDFHVAAYRNTFNAIATISSRGDEVSVHAVAEVLNQQSFLKQIGGVAGLMATMSGLPFHSDRLLKQWQTTLRSHALKRRAFELAKSLALKALDPKLTGEDLIAEADLASSSLRANSSTRSTLKTYKQVAHETRAEVQSWREGVTTAISTGIPELDRKLWGRGLSRSELYFIAAMTSMGKTALALQIVSNAEQRGLRGATFSMEMKATRLLLRNVQRFSSGLEISPYTMREIAEPRNEKQERRKLYSDYAYRRVNEILSQMEHWRGVIDDETRNWQSMKAKCRQLHSEEPLDYILGDYIQLGENRRPGRERRDLEIAEISKESVALAKELNVPFIWISQFSREAKPGVKPELGWLKEASQLEQDADCVLFLYGKGVTRDRKREVMLYCPKQRSGTVDWEIAVDFATDRQMMLTPELQKLIDQSPMTEDERFLMDFLQSAKPIDTPLLDQAVAKEPVADDDIKF